MSLKILERKQFLSKLKENGHRLTIGFAGIADLRSLIGFEFINGIMSACADYDINFINMGGAVKYSLFDDIHFVQNYLKNFKFMKKPFIDGLVTWTSSFFDFMDQESIFQIFNELLPLPMVDIGYFDIPGISHIKINSITAVEKMMAHLIEDHGYKKFAFLGAKISSPHYKRLATYQKELKKYGIKELKNSVYMAESLKEYHIAEAVEELLKHYDLHNKESIEAIVTTTDIIASVLIDILAEKGISVPKDVAVTGFNNWYEGITSRSPLTTIDLSYFKRGYASIEILIDKIATNDKESRTFLFETSLVKRQSCGCQEINFSAQNSLELNLNDESENSLREYLTFRLKEKLTSLSTQTISQAINAFFEDIYSFKKESSLLAWFLELIQEQWKNKTLDSDYFQNIVFELRNVLLLIAKNQGIDEVIHLEDIFHQMQKLISVFQKYESFATRENPYRMNNISEQTLNFTSAKSVSDVIEILCRQMGEYDIPFFVLALSKNPTRSFPSPKIEYIFPPKLVPQIISEQTITEPQLFPKEVFPENRRYSLVLEVLHNRDFYYGYIFFEMKKANVAVYDVLRLLLSNAFFNIYSNSKTDNQFLTETQIAHVLPINKKSLSAKQNRISQEKITKYLISNLNEATNIQKMAEFFMVSKSFLSKKTKELTGNTVGELHDKLKIEQAKNMLLTEIFSLEQISSALGFKNQNYFSAVFKKITGLSPRNWLKKR